MPSEKRITWLLVADASHAKVFESAGARKVVHELENPTDPHRQLKRNFAKKVVAELRRAMLAHKFDRLFLIAPPAFLGDLRDELPKDLKDKVAGEIASDLTNMPQQQLHARLQEILTGERSA